MAHNEVFLLIGHVVVRHGREDLYAAGVPKAALGTRLLADVVSFTSGEEFWNFWRELLGGFSHFMIPLNINYSTRKFDYSHRKQLISLHVLLVPILII